MSDINVFQGTIPALMTPCDQQGAPDYDALVATGKQLIDLGMRAVVYCGSMGDWPLLSDGQRREGVRRLADAGIPVVVGTVKGPKINGFTYKNKSNQRRRWGHRQRYATIEITAIAKGRGEARISA